MCVCERVCVCACACLPQNDLCLPFKSASQLRQDLMVLWMCKMVENVMHSKAVPKCCAVQADKGL